MLTLVEIKNTTPTEPTPGVQKAELWRDQINEGREKIIAPDYSCVVYLFELNGFPCATGYVGRAKKPSLYTRFKTDERRAEVVAEFVNNNMKRKTQRRTADARTLKVGDVLSCMWGYEQTNIDYYLVTQLVGKCSVELVEIAAEKQETDHMQGKCIPDKTNIIGTPFKKRADGDSVKISSFQHASKKEPLSIAGAEVFTADHFTAYY